ncbi:hypothetical protein JHK85_000532 [Glycine max]|nr:hypothetical protein JHK85_000532 [Glycine max]
MQLESLFSLGFSRPDANQVVIEEATRVANAHSFIIKLPEGYETQVSQLKLMLLGEIGPVKNAYFVMVVETIVLPMTHKERFQKFGIGPLKGVPLYGPPGTGKTLIVHACTTQTNAIF